MGVVLIYLPDERKPLTGLGSLTAPPPLRRCCCWRLGVVEVGWVRERVRGWVRGGGGGWRTRVVVDGVGWREG